MSTSTSYITHGYTDRPGQGPLSVIALAQEHLLLIGTITPQPALVARLEQGEPAEVVLGELTYFNHMETKVPLSGLQELRWREGQNSIQVVYENEQGRQRRTTTYLSDERSRQKLLDALANHYGHPLVERVVPAGLLRIIWMQLLEAVMGILGGAVIYAKWDPLLLARIRGGKMALRLGREGSVVVAAVFVLACLADAWRRTHPAPLIHRWVV